MSYSYEQERVKLFTDDGQRYFIAARDIAKAMLKDCGAFRAQEWTARMHGDSWMMLACLDRMIELGELVRWERPGWAQYAIYTSPDTNNRG